MRPREFPDTRPSLLASIQDSGLDAAWHEFFTRYAPAVYRVATLQGLKANDADDIVQHVMIRVARKISRFQYDRNRGRFRQWIRRLTQRCISDHFRKQGRAPDVVASLDDMRSNSISADEIWEREWQLQDMHDCLDRIAHRVSPRRMRVFRMYVLEGATARETAAATGVSENYVYLTRHQIINVVRDEMKKLI